MKIAEFNGTYNMGRRGRILLGLHRLGLNMEQHEKLGLLKYRNPLLLGVMIFASLFGMLGGTDDCDSGF